MTDMTAARAAAEWWADAVGAPKFDMGADSVAASMSEVLAGMLASGHPVNEDQQKSFVEILQARIEAGMGDRSWGFSLGVDYGPDAILADAAEEVGISTSRFPWKSSMLVYPDRVTAHRGYAADDKLIWASDEWLANRPVCGRQKYDESVARRSLEYHGDPWKCSLPLYHESDCLYDTPLPLCTVCGRKDDWWHKKDERGHMKDFHAFAAPVMEKAPWEHEGHKPVQHRDAKPPWCKECGWTSPTPELPAMLASMIKTFG